MHGTLLQQGEGEAHRSRSRHMPSVKTDTDHFLKDGRTISVGDCALFKPSQDSPPFIGIIRALSQSKENNLRLRVNWLYRPAELKLDKGILLEAAPNEIFYSFHKDKIPAASLLHPCRVAFLPKGVELPSGISSFVCRRVFDTENKRLWWLTDQDYINERQEEVDQLLYKTRIDMHGTGQPGGRSPKPLNGATSTSQLRAGSDSVQNMTSFPSQVKGKKRERGDHCSDPVKRERSMKTDGGDSGQSRTEGSFKSEIAKITEKGGLVDSEGVDKFVNLMQPDKVEKMDLICRSMLAGVIVATDKFDCLNRFVQLRGLPVLDEWLQNIHKGQIIDGSSSKDGDKSVEEFLLVLLRALDKLPVNLHALQMCNIGRSVNHLRSHKNLEIQKKARSLVDTWKKRVEAEMNIIDGKSGSNQTVPWSSKSRLPEASHGGDRSSVGTGDIVVKNSVTQFSASKTSLNRPSQGETTKSACSPPGPVQSASSPTSVRESQPRTMIGGASDVPPATREDKSSSSSQSHNYGQSLSGKEDAKSPTAGSMSVNKFSSGGSRHRKLINGFPGTSVSGGQKETGTSRSSSLQKSSALEHLSHSGLPGEKVLNVPVVEGSIQKLIVKIPNRGRGPVQSASGGSTGNHPVMSSRASSPLLSGKHDQLEHNVKDRSDSFRANLTSDVNVDSWQSNEFKDVVIGSDEGDRSPSAHPHEERSRTAEDISKAAEICKAASASSGNELKYGKWNDASFCSMNALIESCVKYSEVNTSMPIGDDVGMNLLASVAAGEISKSDLVSPADSPRRSSHAAEKACIADDARSKPAGNILVQGGNQPNDEGGGNDKKHFVVTTRRKDELHQVICTSPEFSGDRIAESSSSEEKPAAECIECSNYSADLRNDADCCLEVNGKLDEMKDFTSLSSASMEGQRRDGEQNRHLEDGVSDVKPCGSSVGEVKVLSNEDDGKQKVEDTSSNESSDDESKNNVTQRLNTVCHVTQKSPSRLADGEVLPPPISGKDLVADATDELKARGADDKGSRDLVNESERERHVKDTSSAPAVEDCSMFPLDSAVTDHKRVHVVPSDETKQVMGRQSTISPQKESFAYSAEDVLTRAGVRGSKLSDAEAEMKECTSKAEASSSSGAGTADTSSKMKFDLNEGFIADDIKYGEQITMTAPVSPSSLQIINTLPIAASSTIPASVTVAAAAKGPFVPPEDLLRSKGELGWKGSAATSAFRPAEPRKVLQTSLVSTGITASDASPSKHGRAPLDIDLNVPDERVLEDLVSRDSATEICSSLELRSDLDISRNGLTGSAVRSSGALDLDLNRTDETNDMGQCSASSSHRLELAIVPVKSLTSGGLSTSELGRGFDLNNGPWVDDANAEQSSFNQHAKGSMHIQPPVAGLRMNNPEMGSLSSWFPPGNPYSTVTIPSFLADRGKQPFPIIPPGAPPRIFGPAGSTPFTPDVFRGSVLSSSPAVPFPSNPFQYPVYPFGTTFPMPSATFSVGPTSYIDSSSAGRLFTPPLNSQLLGPVDAVYSQYPRPYVVSCPEGSSLSSTESMRKWGKQGLDLNAGPGALEVQGREEMLPIVSNKLSIASSQSLSEEQARIYPVGGGVLRRKEPDRGWNDESFRSKQSSWQ